MFVGNQFCEKMIWLFIGLDVQEDEDGYYCVWVFVILWVLQCFSLFIRQIVDWEEVGVMFVLFVMRNIYCFYDGGMDVFFGVGSLFIFEVKF